MDQSARVQPTHLRLVAETLPENVIRRSNGILYGCVEVDGHQIRKSLGTRNAVEAEEKVRRWLAEVSPRHASSELTFAQVASSYIEAYQSELSDKTWRRYKTSLKMLRPFFGDILWTDVTRTKINEFITTRRQSGATVATVNRDLTVLSNIIEHAVDQEWSDENPLRNMSRKKRREKRDPFILPSDVEIEHAWNHMHGTFGDLARFALETGMRLDEIAPLEVKNVSPERRAAQLFKTKTRTVRLVGLSDTAIQVVKRQKREKGLLFVTRDGERYKSISGMWRDVMRRASNSWSDHHPDHPYTKFRFHDLRHIFAIRFLRNGGNLYVLQKQLGHSTIRQTESYLAYLTTEEQAAAQWGPDQMPDHSAAVISLTRGK